MNKVVGIVQARMASERLPGKVMLELRGHPIIKWIYERLARSTEISQLVFAIPDTEADDLLYSYLSKLGACVIRGSENDVLARFCKAAGIFGADIVCRICADNPCICPETVDSIIRLYREKCPDYAYNHIPVKNLYPDGLGAEVVSRGLLEELMVKTSKPKHREHIFSYIWDNRNKYDIVTDSPRDSRLKAPWIRLDVDTYQDYKSLNGLKINIASSSSAIVREACDAWWNEEVASRSDHKR